MSVADWPERARTQDRLAFIEELLRGARIHEAECNYREYQRAQSRSGAWLNPEYPGYQCNCWLSEGVSDE